MLGYTWQRSKLTAKALGYSAIQALAIETLRELLKADNKFDLEIWQ